MHCITCNHMDGMSRHVCTGLHKYTCLVLDSSDELYIAGWMASIRVYMLSLQASGLNNAHAVQVCLLTLFTKC